MSTNNKLTNRDRFRLLAMVKLGEWFDSRDHAFRLAVRTLYVNHQKWVDDEISAEKAMLEIGAAIDMLDELDDDFLDVQRDVCSKTTDGTYAGEVYLTRRGACEQHRKVTILPAVKATKKLAPAKDEA